MPPSLSGLWATDLTSNEYKLRFRWYDILGVATKPEVEVRQYYQVGLQEDCQKDDLRSLRTDELFRSFSPDGESFGFLLPIVAIAGCHGGVPFPGAMPWWDAIAGVPFVGAMVGYGGILLLKTKN